jgi:hypothetical protein
VSAGATRAWTFLTSHAQVLLCIAHDPGIRLRDIGTTLGITERRAYGIVADLTEAGHSSRNETDAATATNFSPTCPSIPQLGAKARSASCSPCS